MPITEEGLAIIMRHEGFSPVRYICPAGYPTIGYGHVIKNGEDFGTISKEEGAILLQRDVVIAEQAVKRLISVPLNDNQFAALVSFTFNLGSGSLQRSTLRRKLNRGEYEAASQEFHKWVWAGGRKLRGLINRRADEAALFRAMPPEHS